MPPYWFCSKKVRDRMGSVYSFLRVFILSLVNLLLLVLGTQYILLKTAESTNAPYISIFFYIALLFSIILTTYFVHRLVLKEKENLRLRQLAYYDDLTGLYNRRALLNLGESYLNSLSPKRDQASVLFIDLDKFKTVNDELGHHTGDLLLKAFCHRFKSFVREKDIIGRYGGDEFIVILSDIDQEDTLTFAQRALEEMAKPIFINSKAISITPSMGISLYPTDGHTLEILIDKADKAMYRAKEFEDFKYQFYDSLIIDTLLNASR
ncbi:GGDEF domain-containing protein [Anaerosolibacter sp.]|uniref:GGDEF domain-containing protein n=1 Tax=Anaerosolibacter sp. TaxID=1872527 RepID=UPI0039EF82BA